MSGANIPKEGDVAGRVERIFRKFFERLGGALDFALRRPLNPHSRTDLTVLIPQLERAIEENLRHRDGKTFAPNRIDLRYDYETYTQLAPKRREYLERELRLSAYEYIHNRRYAAGADIQVTITYDMFTRALTIKPSFADAAQEPADKPDTPLASAREPFEVTLKGRGVEFHASAITRIDIGRGRDNALRIEEPSISAVHAAFTCNQQGMCYLTDLGSSNGTFVNGVAIPMGDKTLVRSGDRLRFGELETVLELK